MLQDVGLSLVVKTHQGSLECIHACREGPDRRGKQTQVRLKQTKCVRCEYRQSQDHLCDQSSYQALDSCHKKWRRNRI